MGVFQVSPIYGLYVKWQERKSIGIYGHLMVIHHTCYQICAIINFSLKVYFVIVWKVFCNLSNTRILADNDRFARWKVLRPRQKLPQFGKQHKSFWWKGRAISRQNYKYQELIREAYKAMFEQNERFRVALMSTRGMKLYHSRGEQNSYKTILTESEFCSILTEMRDTYNHTQEWTLNKKEKALYFDTDGVLVDFESGLAQQCEQTLKKYEELRFN